MEMVLLLGLLLFFIATSLPIGISIGLATLITMVTTTDTPTIMMAQYAFTSLDSFPLMAIPFFIMAGNLMSTGGISRRIVNFANEIIGDVTGGLGIVTIIACTFFAAISGSGPATVSAIGAMMIPEMYKSGYPKAFGTALTCAGGTIGCIIPPSIPFVVYCVITGASVGQLFTAGFLPGLLMSLVLSVICYFESKKHGYGKTGEKKVKIGKFKSFIDSFWALLTPLIILGGIYSGMFTPTESAVVAIVYAIFAGMFIYKELTLDLVLTSIKETAVMTGITLFTIGLAASFASYLTMEQIPAKIATSMLALTQNKYIILMLINIFLLICGCFIDNISIITITTPIFMPIVTALGVDLIHFGVIITLVTTIGFVTPPYGANLFVATALTGLKIEEIVKPLMPFFIGLLICLVLTTYIPGLSLLLVDMFFR